MTEIENTVQGADPASQRSAVDTSVLVGQSVEEIGARFNPLPFRTGEIVVPQGPEALAATISGPPTTEPTP